jgi:hypothetical protein
MKGGMQMTKTIFIVVGVIVVVLVLGAAAFVGGGLLRGQGLPIALGAGGQNLVFSDGGKTQQVELNIQPAKELPQTPAAARGIFLRRQDNSIFIGTGNVQMQAIKKDDGTVSTSSSHDGPEVEIVITPQTIVYADTTMKQFDGPPPGGQPIQQVVEPGKLDDVGENSDLTVWGNKSGDRITATVLVYSLPAFVFKR